MGRHKHHLKIKSSTAHAIIFVCDICSGSIAYDKFAIRRVVVGRKVKTKKGME